MTDRIGFEDAGLQRMEQATLWLQRMRTSGQDDRVVEAWLDWCQRDPLNQQAFDEIAAIWEISGQIPRDSVAPQRTATFSRRALVASLAAIGIAGIAGAAWWNSTRDAVLTTRFTSPIGINTVQKLADGSVLTLGGGTRVTVTIGPKERRVELLQGEVFAAVHHDTSRPFSVVSGRLEVVATGTAFNVRRSVSRTTVTVTEGSVAAFDEGRTAETNVRLQPGQQLVYSHESHTFDIRETDPQVAIAWRSGILGYDDEPLAEVVATINRYVAKGIVLDDDPRITEFLYAGSVDIRNLDGWLRGMESNITSVRVGVTNLADGRRLIAPQRDALPD